MKISELSALPDKSEDGKDAVKCLFCEKVQWRDCFWVWRGNQTAIRTLKCDDCGKSSAVKMFAEVDNNTVDGIPNFNTKFYEFGVPETSVRQGRGPKCSGCSQPTYTRVIDQSRFINNELVCCPCGVTNEIWVAGPTILDHTTNKDNKCRQVGEWLTAAKRENMRKQKAKENREKFERIQNEGIQSAIFSSAPKIPTANQFESLASDTTLTEQDDSSSIVSGGGGASASSRNSKRKVTASPEGDGAFVTARRHKKIARAAETRQSSREQPREPETTTNIPDRLDTRGAKSAQTNMSHNTTQEKRLPVIVCTNDKWLENQAAFKQSLLLAKKHKCIMKTDKNTGKFFFTPNTMESRQAIIDELKSSDGCEFYTYGTKYERRASKKVIAKGIMTTGFSETEVIEDISDRYGLKPQRAIVLKNAAMILIFEGSTDMRDIKNIRIILNQRAKIEKYRVKVTAVTQCKNCLQFGHVQAHCNRKKKDEVETDTDNDGKSVMICSNCKEPGHTARQAKCPIFKDEIKRQKERRLKFSERTRNPNTENNTKSSWTKIQPGVSFADKTANKQTNINEGIKDTIGDLSNTLLTVMSKITELVESLQKLSA